MQLFVCELRGLKSDGVDSVYVVRYKDEVLNPNKKDKSKEDLPRNM